MRMRWFFLRVLLDPERGFTGTCYRAANWVYLGRTTGRGKNDSTNKANRRNPPHHHP